MPYVWTRLNLCWFMAMWVTSLKGNLLFFGCKTRWRLENYMMLLQGLIAYSKSCYFLLKLQQDCPNGRLTPAKFVDMYKMFFPSGNAEEFCDHVFRTFDMDKNGYIDFKVSNSIFNPSADMVCNACSWYTRLNMIACRYRLFVSFPIHYSVRCTQRLLFGSNSICVFVCSSLEISSIETFIILLIF